MSEQSDKQKMKREQINFAKTQSYKDLFQESLRFLTAVSEQNIQKGKTIITESSHNHRVRLIYSFIISILEQKKEMQAQLSQKDSNLQRIKAEIRRLEQTNSALRKKGGSKTLSPLISDRDRIKLKIIEQIEDGFLYQARELASKHNFSDLEGNIQRIWEHKWMEAEIKRKLNRDKHSPSKEEHLSFSKEFERIRNHVLSDELEKVLSQMINFPKKINFQGVALISPVKQYLMEIQNLLHPIKQAAEREAEEEKKVIELLQKYFPDFERKQENYSFYKIIRKFIEFQKELEEGSFRNSFTNNVSENNSVKLGQLNSELPIPMTLSTARSEETRSDQLITNINKHIKKLDMVLKTTGLHRDQGTETNYYIEVLNRAINITEKFRSLKDINSILAAAEEEAIKSIIQINHDILDFVKIINPIEISPTENSVKVAMTAFGNNFKEVFRQLRVKITLRNSVDSSSKITADFGKAFIPYYESQQSSDQEERRYIKSLVPKSREELVDIIKQLRNVVSQLQEEALQNKQKERLMQNRIKKLDNTVRESEILIQSSISPIEGGQFLIEELTLAKQRLIDDLNRKNTELDQMKNSIQRMIEDSKFELQLQHSLQIKRCQQLNQKEIKKCQEELKEKQIKIKKLKEDLLVYEMKAEETGEFSRQKNQQLNEAQSLIKSLSIQKQKLQVEFQSLKSEYKNLQSNQCHKSLLCKQQKINIQTISNTPQPHTKSLSSRKKGLSLSRTEDISILSTDSHLQSDPNLLKEIKRLEEQVQESASQLTELKEELISLGKKNQEQNQLLEEKERQIQHLNQLYSDINEKYKVQAGALTQNTGHLFALGSIFAEENSADRQYLIDTLTNLIGPISRTNLLYRYDPFNKTNPHKYIDKHRHLVVILKTLYGRYIAAYSRQMIDPSGCRAGYGLLISIWNKNVYEVLDKKKAVTYDDYFIIFGNSELRLKSQEIKIFSNFGINNGYFNNRGHKVDSFLGEGSEREVPLESYEFYSLELQY